MQAVEDDIMLQHSGKAAPAAMEANSMQERMASPRIRFRSHGKGTGRRKRGGLRWRSLAPKWLQRKAGCGDAGFDFVLVPMFPAR